MTFAEQFPVYNDGINLEGVSKSYNDTPVLHHVAAHFPRGQMSIVAGPSGSGKTTLLNIAAGLDKADTGLVLANGFNVSALETERERTAFRSNNGYIFQNHGLLGGLSVRQNIYLPHEAQEHDVDPAWVNYLMGRLGVAQCVDQHPSTLSGGQAQRVSIVRALAHQPQIVYADEPSAALDSSTKAEVYNVLGNLTHDHGVTTVVVSHDDVALEAADKVIHLRDGIVRGAYYNKKRR